MNFTDVLDNYFNNIIIVFYKISFYNIYKCVIQILLEKTHNLQLKDVYCVYKNKKVLNNRYKEYNLSLHTF